MEKPDFQLERYEQDDKESKISKKFKDNPTVPVGMAAFVGIAAYGLYKFRTTKERPSVYLIQLRVAAQGTIIGILTLGVLYQFYTKELRPKLSTKKSD